MQWIGQTIDDTKSLADLDKLIINLDTLLSIIDEEALCFAEQRYLPNSIKERARKFDV